MPTNRRRRFDRGRRDVMNLNQRSFLECGTSFWTHLGEEEFEDEAHARAAWARHRDEIMANYHQGPGRRPWAFWAYDLEVPIDGPGTNDFRWSAIGAESESHAVHLLVETRHAERLEIEEHWISLIERSRYQGGEGYACRWGGCPRGFYEKHAPAIREQEAEEDAWRAKK